MRSCLGVAMMAPFANLRKSVFFLSFSDTGLQLPVMIASFQLIITANL